MTQNKASREPSAVEEATEGRISLKNLTVVQMQAVLNDLEHSDPQAYRRFLEIADRKFKVTPADIALAAAQRSAEGVSAKSTRDNHVASALGTSTVPRQTQRRITH